MEVHYFDLVFLTSLFAVLIIIVSVIFLMMEGRVVASLLTASGLIVIIAIVINTNFNNTEILKKDISEVYGSTFANSINVDDTLSCNSTYSMHQVGTKDDTPFVHGHELYCQSSEDRKTWDFLVKSDDGSFITLKEFAKANNEEIVGMK